MPEENARGNQNCPTHDTGASSRDGSRADTGGSTDAVAQREQTGQGAHLTESDGCAADNSSDSSLQNLVANIDAETLEQRQHAHSTTNRDKRDRCPACGSVNLRHKVGGANPVRKAGKYHCSNCGEHFDAPVTPDTDQEVATDGGQNPDADATFEPYEPEPQRFAEVHVTVGGAMQFVDDDQPECWIIVDTVVEVTR